MSDAEVRRIAPNLDFRLWRPVIAEPPMCSLRDLHEWVTLDALMDMHEALDLRAALAEKARHDNGGH